MSTVCCTQTWEVAVRDDDVASSATRSSKRGAEFDRGVGDRVKRGLKRGIPNRIALMPETRRFSESVVREKETPPLAAGFPGRPGLMRSLSAI